MTSDEQEADANRTHDHKIYLMPTARSQELPTSRNLKSQFSHFENHIETVRHFHAMRT